MTPTHNKNKRLAAYSQQAKQLKAPHNQLKKYAALVATPLAALPAAVLAQCGSATITGTNPIQIDLDGGGVDFSVSLVGSSVFLTNQNNGVFSVANDGSYPVRFNTGQDIAAYGNFTNNFQATLGISTFAGPFVIGNSGFIGVRKGNMYGFIQLSVVAGPSISVNASLTGLADIDDSAEAGICATLPVEMTTFTAKAVERKIALSWETATEENNAGFEIQRSTDGDKFHKIGWVDGNGTTVDAQSYAFVDDKAIANKTYYYRLRQVDLDGTFAYSDIVKASVVKKGGVVVGEVFPNPVQEASILNIEVAETTEAVVSIFESTGKLLQIYTTELQSGTNQLNLEMRDYAAGVYFVKIEANGEQVYRKVSKQ